MELRDDFQKNDLRAAKIRDAILESYQDLLNGRLNLPELTQNGTIPSLSCFYPTSIVGLMFVSTHEF